MAIYKIFPTQDATMYSLYPNKNTGLDEIIEASLETEIPPDPTPQASRFLIQFSQDEIIDVIDNKISGSQWQSNLRCFIANVSAFTKDTTLEVYPVSQSWDMGLGKFAFDPEVQNGVSWIWKDYYGGSTWTSGVFNLGTTGSFPPSGEVGGGTWYTSYGEEQTFGYYSSKDLNIETSGTVRDWYDEVIPNNGFIVKQKDEFIDNINDQPKIKYFSIDTHTIYSPCLEFKWNDCIINTGSSTLSILNVQPFVVSIGNSPGTFYPNDVNIFRVYSRPQFPARVFSTASYFTQNYYLPTASYYAIQDLDTNEYVIDFDNVYTKLSMDSTSSYFKLYMNGLEPERYYKILIKTTVNRSTVVLDDSYYFKVING